MSNELLTRGVQDVMPRPLAEEKLKSGKIRIYFGIDPTGTKLHLGHAIPLRKLQAFAEAGHDAILLIGSFTAMIGDPTGRDAMREPLTRKQVEDNFKTYKKQASKILDFKKVRIEYNHKWLEKITTEEFLKLSSHFTVQQMMQRDMFRERMKWKVKCPHCTELFNSPIQFQNEEEFANETSLDMNITAKCSHCGKDVTLTRDIILPPPNPVTSVEFIYPLMQGYDSVMLEVDAEIGGNDQLFNMLAGRKLLKVYKQKEKFVITTPLLEGLDGRKMSKTYGNTVDLTDDPSAMFGKLMSLKDELIIKYFRLCTNVPLQEIDEIAAGLKRGANPRDAKIRLAQEIVTLYHSAKSAADAQEEFARVFTGGGVPDDIPEFKLTGAHNIIDLILACKLAPSKSEARRLVEQGGVKLNDEKITAHDAKVHLKKGTILQVGKRKFARII